MRRALTSIRWVTPAVAVCALLVATPARASIIYSTFGPGDSYDTDDGYNIGGSIEQELAASFVPSVDATLDSIRVATFGSSNDFTFYLAADNGGVPGAALETFSGLSFTNPSSILTLNSLLTPLLNAGTTYWLVATAPDLAASNGAWNRNDQGFSGLTFQTVNDSWFHTGNPAPAFEINGTQVPEPATLLMLGSGAAFALRRRLRCRKTSSTP